MDNPTNLELGGLAVLGTLGSVCAVLLRSTNKNLQSLEQMREEAAGVIEQLRGELRGNDDTISKLQAMCANYRYQVGALRAERRQLKLEVERLRAAHPMPKPTKEEQEDA
jgi:septal ring factor EnvC (AmiA/AmiB activator)